MTLDKAREFIAMHVQPGSGYNRNSARMVLGEVIRDLGQEVVDQLIRETGLKQKWQIKPGTHIESAFKQ